MSRTFKTVAGIFSLLNDLRLATGKPSLGFINPLIYSAAVTGFNDITSGSNPGCGTPGEDSQNVTRVCFLLLMLDICQVLVLLAVGIP
jgi:hypothetical protein